MRGRSSHRVPESDERRLDGFKLHPEPLARVRAEGRRLVRRHTGAAGGRDKRHQAKHHQFVDQRVVRLVADEATHDDTRPGEARIDADDAARICATYQPAGDHVADNKATVGPRGEPADAATEVN